jgi:hypothetical protein
MMGAILVQLHQGSDAAEVVTSDEYNALFDSIFPTVRVEQYIL